MSTSLSFDSLPRLENDIVEIMRLHDLRGLAYKLRDEGLKSLLDAYLSPSRSSRWVSQREEPDDYIHPALLFLVASRRFAIKQYPVESERVRNRTRRKLAKLRVRDVFKASSRQASPHASRVPIFQAARICQALLSTPDTIFSRTFWIGYYRIIRELHATSEPSWSIGGARIVEGARPSAFMTGECVRVVLGLARAFEDTSRQVSAIYESFERIRETMELQNVPSDWKAAESERVLLSGFVSIARFSARSMLDLPDTMTEALCNREEPLNGAIHRCNTFLSELSVITARALDRARSGVDEATDRIERFHGKELAAVRKRDDEVEALRLELPHAIGLRALRAGSDTLTILENLNRRLSDGLSTGVPLGKVAPAALTQLAEMAKTLNAAADRIRRVLSAAREFVNSVLDREAEKEKTGHVDASELAFAAATEVALKKATRDPRLNYALKYFEGHISLEGAFPHSNALDTAPNGYSFYVTGAEIVRAVAQLVEKVDFEASVDFTERLLTYFQTTMVAVPDTGEVTGWHHDQPRFPKRALLWTSALAVLALDRLGRMLDKRINRRVYRHFTTTRPGREHKATPLERLIAPDYGLAYYHQSLPEKARPAMLQGEPVSHFFERARAHVHGVSAPQAYDQACFSLILFGPPGTGKTTLVKGLAASAGLPLIEITPSDFLVEGEPFFERRARAIFDALRTVTDTVVLLDEMDEILQKRSTEVNRNTNIYSLLRPGMLPKFSALNEAARTQRMAYVLNTNFIQNMDEAAIRGERFDVKIGVHPPDLLSRCGALGAALERSAKSRGLDKFDAAVMLDALHQTSGGSMPALAKLGIFLPLLSTGRLPKNSVVGPTLKLVGDSQFVPPEPETRFESKPPEEIEKMSSSERCGYLRWDAIERWDASYRQLRESVADTATKWNEEDLQSMISAIVLAVKEATH